MTLCGIARKVYGSKMRECDLPVTALRNSNLFSGVIALESAGYFHGLNMYGLTPLVLMSNTSTELVTSYVRHVPFVSSLQDDMEHIGGALYVTNPERTVCELVLADGNDEFILQSISAYLAKYGNAQVLMSYAKKYNCTKQMRHRLKEAAALDN